jgi:hypothetical protein
LFDIIDQWTLIPWDKNKVEMTVTQISHTFYNMDKILLLLEEIWDILELVDSPTEYMTEERIKRRFELLLSDESVERCAKAIHIEMSFDSEPIIEVLNAKEIIEDHPEWFDDYVHPT